MNGATVLVIAVLIALPVLTRAQNDEHSVDPAEQSKQLQWFTKRKPTGMWFGPRLGRKKRNPGFEDGLKNLLVDREQMEELLEAIQDSPLAVLALSTNSNGKRQTMNFTPRLGRESAEEISHTGSGRSSSILNGVWPQDPELGNEYVAQRSPPFAPRLGRTNSKPIDFWPRPG